jgi:hypothetical protein
MKTKTKKQLFVITMLVMLVSLGFLAYMKSSDVATVTVEVCYDIADIEIAKCQSYENGCINPRVLINVVSDNPGAKASAHGGKGFYIVRNSHHKPRTVHVDRGETKYETFGCSGEE